MVWARRVVVCLTRHGSNRDRYGYTHPSPTVNLHTGKGCQIPERFSSLPPNGELVLASTFTVGSNGTVLPPLSGIPRENARMNEIIIMYEGKEKRGAKFQPDNCHGAEKYRGYLVREHRCDLR